MATPIILADNVFRLATPTATHTAAGFDIRSIADYRAWTKWKGATTNPCNIMVNCGAAQPADAVGIVGHNLFTAGALVRVYSSPDGANWTLRGTVGYPTSNKALLVTFTQATAQYWLLTLDNCTAAAEIGELFLGSRLTFPKQVDKPWTPYVARVKAETAIGETGHILGSTLRYTALEMSPRWTGLRQAWVYGDYKTFWDNHAKLLRPFYWAPDLDNYSTEVYFVSCPADAQFLVPRRTRTYTENLTLKMVGVLET